jgi:hypothetical protein
MTTVTYEIVEHDGGWAYKVGDSCSETYATRDYAVAAARIAAAEQQVAGVTTPISWEDRQGKWHAEIAMGNDRPNTEIKV